jgi:hypothetical protein
LSLGLVCQKLHQPLLDASPPSVFEQTVFTVNRCMFAQPKNTYDNFLAANPAGESDNIFLFAHEFRPFATFGDRHLPEARNPLVTLDSNCGPRAFSFNIVRVYATQLLC